MKYLNILASEPTAQPAKPTEAAPKPAGEPAGGKIIMNPAEMPLSTFKD